MLAERQRAAKRESLRTRKHSGGGARKATGVSLAGSGHQMSILELLQYIVNEPAPRLPAGRFSPACEQFVDATLRKEPVGWNVKKKGPLPKEVARPTPKELLVRLALSFVPHLFSMCCWLTRRSCALHRSTRGCSRLRRPTSTSRRSRGRFPRRTR